MKNNIVTAIYGHRKSEKYFDLLKRSDRQDVAQANKIETCTKIGGTSKTNKRIRMRQKNDAIFNKTVSGIDRNIERKLERQQYRELKRRKKELNKLNLIGLSTETIKIINQ